MQEDSSSNHGCGFLWLFPCDWHEGCAIWWQDDPAQPLFDFQCHDAASGYSNLYLCSHDKVPSPAPTPRPSGVPTPAPQAEKIDDDDDGLLGVSAAGVDSRTGAVAGLAVVTAVASQSGPHAAASIAALQNSSRRCVLRIDMTAIRLSMS